jgi:hypothetical protein
MEDVALQYVAKPWPPRCDRSLPERREQAGQSRGSLRRPKLLNHIPIDALRPAKALADLVFHSRWICSLDARQLRSDVAHRGCAASGSENRGNSQAARRAPEQGPQVMLLLQSTNR